MKRKNELLDELGLSSPIGISMPMPRLTEEERQLEKELGVVYLPRNLLQLCDNVYQYALACSISRIHSSQDHCWGLQWAADMLSMSLNRARKAARSLEAKGLLVIEPILPSDQLYASGKLNSCSYCGLAYDLLDWHHIIPCSEGGSDDPDNLTYLCPNCHRLAHTLNYVPVWRL